MNNLKKINWDLLSASAALLCILLAIAAYEPLISGIAFGYDEVHYYKDFTFKLTEDGRWLNYAFLPLLRIIPNNLWLVCYLFALWLFFFNVANDLGAGRPLSAIVASLVLTTPPYIHQSLWPATSFIGILSLLIAQFTSRRVVNPASIYFPFAIILFGTLQSYYFMLPLVFANKIKIAEASNFEEKLKFLILHLTLWSLASIVGVMVMSAILLITTGNFGVSPAPWRHIQPTANIKDLINNIAYVFSELKIKTLSLFFHSSLKYLYVAITIAYAFSIKRIFNNFHIFSLLLIIAVSFFVFSIPLAPVIQERSLFAMAASFVLLLALPGILEKNWRRAITSLTLLGFAIYYVDLGKGYLASDQNLKNLLIDKILISIPSPPQNFNGVAVFNLAKNTSKEGKFYNSAPLMHGLFHSIGFKEFRDCRIDKNNLCTNDMKDRHLHILPFLNYNIRFGVTADNWLTLRLVNNINFGVR